MRKLGWLGVFGVFMAVATSTAESQSRGNSSCRARTARRRRSSSPPSAASRSTYKAPRTPWGDPDLQGVWSSDDMEGVGIAARRRTRRARGGALRRHARRPGLRRCTWTTRP